MSIAFLKDASLWCSLVLTSVLLNIFIKQYNVAL